MEVFRNISKDKYDKLISKAIECEGFHEWKSHEKQRKERIRIVAEAQLDTEEFETRNNYSTDGSPFTPQRNFANLIERSKQNDVS
ncbi:hypothetical protein V1477_016755 [Vespula maculifrons]|uniref:Uncharacterized protein n=1 Tax=Vespula maculifrons TaxID=7453 RepID=A0ABD2B414_VESMC